MSLMTVSATTMLDDPMIVTAQQVPLAVTELLVPLTMRVESLQSMVVSTPCPVMWVSPFLAWATGAGAAGVAAMVATQTASVPTAIVHFTTGPPSLGGWSARSDLA